MSIEAGFAYHIHHDVLVEWCTDYAQRVKFIKEMKPKEEQKLRLRLFQLIPDAVIKSLPSYAEWEKAYAERDKAYAERDKAYAEWDKAYAIIIAELTKLHSQLCPDCTWNGKTIF